MMRLDSHQHFWKYNPLGNTRLNVSRLSFGASALGGVYGPTDEAEGIRAVHTALDLGINYFDVAPAYGGTVAESVLGKALKGIPRDRYYLSTKVGKYTQPGGYGDDTLDYSRARLRASIDESAGRLGTEYFDIIHLHDFEYQHRRFPPRCSAAPAPNPSVAMWRGARNHMIPRCWPRFSASWGRS